MPVFLAEGTIVSETGRIHLTIFVDMLKVNLVVECLLVSVQNGGPHQQGSADQLVNVKEKMGWGEKISNSLMGIEYMQRCSATM